MKMTSLLILAFMIGCSSGDKKRSEKSPEMITDADFKKEKPLTNNEVQDFYSGNQSALNPALQDETLDRYSAEEIAQLSGNLDPLLEIAIRCSKGDYNNAFAVASKIFDRYQKVAAYWNQVANCHLNQGSNRKALLFYNKALEVKPNYVPALNNIGVMYARQGQDQKALVAFQRAQKNSKFAKTPRYNLAKLYLSYGLAELARPILEGLLSSSPQDVDLLNAVAASHFLMSNYQAALSYYQKIPRELWTRPEIGLNIALTLHLSGRSKDARAILNNIDRPKQEELKHYYASVQKHIGDK